MAKVGRPTKMTPDTVRKLEEAFAMGCSDSEACLFADISKPTLYLYIEKNPSFSDRKEMLKQNPVLKAKKVILDNIEGGDINTARWMVEKKEGKAKQALEHSGPDGEPIQSKSSVTIDERTLDKVLKKLNDEI